MAIEAQVPSSSPGATGSTELKSAPARDRLAQLFPDPSAPAPPWWHRRRRALVAVIVVALVASGFVAARAFGADDASYRTATVATHDVDALLNGVATIEPVSQSTVGFPASGTVASVAVKVGDQVTIGQQLAALDPQQLTQQLHDQQAALAQAELTLEQALNGEAVSGNEGGGSGSNPVALTAASIPSAADTKLAAAQRAVLAAQQKVDAALHTATQALDAAATVCAAAGVGPPTGATATPETLTACQTAMQDVLAAQQAVSTAQQQLAEAATALDGLLAQRTAAPTDVPSGSTTAGGAPANDDVPSDRDGSGAANAPSAASPSSADLVAYQKAVDAAAAEVAVAEQAIAQATIVSPIVGTVAAVNLAVGDEVDAGSSTATIVVVGAGGYEATTTVSIDDVTDVKVGQAATLLPDGSKQTRAGTVSSISIAPDAGAATTSYRVVIGLTDRGADLENGATGSVAVVTESSRAALAVPTSAITTIGRRHTVTVLDGSTTEPVAVQVGVVGATWTEITGGLTAGQTVVLADLSEPLPGSATESSGSTPTGPGTGRFPGRFSGGGPVFFRGGQPGK